MISNSLTFALGPKFLDCPDDIEASSQSPKDPLNDSADAAEPLAAPTPSSAAAKPLSPTCQFSSSKLSRS
jgi:hypothetical protein